MWPPNNYSEISEEFLELRKECIWNLLEKILQNCPHTKFEYDPSGKGEKEIVTAHGTARSVIDDIYQRYQVDADDCWTLELYEFPGNSRIAFRGTLDENSPFIGNGSPPLSSLDGLVILEGYGSN